MNWSVVRIWRHIWVGWRGKGSSLMSWPCLLIIGVSPETRWVSGLSRLQCTMHARAPSRTFVVTYSVHVHVHCMQSGCDFTLFMASCRVTVTLSRLQVFGNNTLNGIFATTSNKVARKESHFITTLLTICYLLSCHSLDNLIHGEEVKKWEINASAGSNALWEVITRHRQTRRLVLTFKNRSSYI
jgi:hypothetical protein